MAAPPPSDAHVKGTSYVEQQNGNLAKGDVTLEAQVPRPDAQLTISGAPQRSPKIPPGYGTVTWVPPLPGTDCSDTLMVGVNLARAEGQSFQMRRATWQTPKDIFPQYDPAKPAPGWYEMAPGIASIVGDGNTQVPADVRDHTPEVEAQALDAASLFAGSNAIGITYVVVGKIAPAVSGVVCLITDWKYQDTYKYSIGVCNEFRSQTPPEPCKQAIISLTPAAQPPCSSAACVPSVQTVIPPGPLFTQAKQFWTDGGSVISTPDAQWEAVQVPVQLGLQGTPVAQPDQYYSQCQQLGAVRLSSACFQVHLHLAQAIWRLSQDGVPGSKDICTGMTCTYTFDTVGKYHVRVIEDISVEYRYVMFTTPQDAIYQPWKPYPGQPGFQLCALGAPGQAVTPPPDCAPGAALSVGQFEAVPTTPR